MDPPHDNEAPLLETNVEDRRVLDILMRPSLGHNWHARTSLSRVWDDGIRCEMFFPKYDRVSRPYVRIPLKVT